MLRVLRAGARQPALVRPWRGLALPAVSPAVLREERFPMMVRSAGGSGGWGDDDRSFGGDDAAAEEAAWGDSGRTTSNERGRPGRSNSGGGGGGRGGGGGWGSGGGGRDKNPWDNRRERQSNRRDSGGGRGRRGGDSRGQRTNSDSGGGGGRVDWRGRESNEGFQYEARPPKSSIMSKLEGEVVYGVAPVLTALQKKRREVFKLYVQDGMDLKKRKDGGAVRLAVNTANVMEVEVEYISKHDLNMMSDNRPHQGLMLDCGALSWEPMDSFPAPPSDPRATPLWLALDEIMDPQNFGAVLRSAYFLGAAGVVACQKNSAPLSGATSKASAGALEALTVHSCSNMPNTLDNARELGWQVLGADAEPGSLSCSSFVLDKPTILVMGNEGYGLRTNVKRACDHLIKVDSHGTMSADNEGLTMAVDSLNVSVATGILLHNLLTSARAPQPQS